VVAAEVVTPPAVLRLVVLEAVAAVESSITQLLLLQARSTLALVAAEAEWSTEEPMVPAERVVLEL
jgi:hypothetical protein